MMETADYLGTFICWLFNRLLGRKTSLKEELKDAYATKHLIVGYIAIIIFFILFIVCFANC